MALQDVESFDVSCCCAEQVPEYSLVRRPEPTGFPEVGAKCPLGLAQVEGGLNAAAKIRSTLEFRKERFEEPELGAELVVYGLPGYAGASSNLFQARGVETLFGEHGPGRVKNLRPRALCGEVPTSQPVLTNRHFDIQYV